MSVAVVFYSDFIKKVNSTKRPTASNSSISIACLMKGNTSITEPVIEVRGSGATFNPKYYNYCYIATFDRYYFINQWTYISAVWEAHLKVDVLATFKNQIGATSKYILRSAYASNINVVDEFYPALAWEPNYYYDNCNFNFDTSFANGTFILGVANGEPSTGALSYYSMNNGQMATLLRYMIPETTDTWTNGFSGFTDTIYRSVYGPFDYIKSCKWFPIPAVDGSIGVYENVKFGNYISNAPGIPINEATSSWRVLSNTLYLPSGWLSLEAKYRVNPYAHLYIVLNPWGVIELNPMDFTDSRTIKLYMYPDCISGDCMLKIYKVVGSTEYFITERNSNLSVDIALSSASVNIGGLLSGIVTSAGSVARIVGGDVAGGVVGLVGGVGNTAKGIVPTLSSSVGQTFGGARNMEGVATLIYTSTYFANENNEEFGKPLCDTRTINTLQGFTKCQDGDIMLNGAMLQETQEVSEFLTEGFYYE